jgi:hypothetical protein
MEWFLIALTSFLTVISPVGLITDQMIANNIRDRVNSVEALSVRVDNTPSFQLLQGKVQKIRIASRGLEPLENIRLEVFDIETDPIEVDVNNLKLNNLQALRTTLKKPLQGAFHLVITPEDINQALADPNIKNRIQELLKRVLPEDAPPLTLVSAQVTFLENHRIKTQVELQQPGEEGDPPEMLKLLLETGITIQQGKSLELTEPIAYLNDRKISSRLVTGIVGSFSDRLTLATLENQGIIARVLKFEISPQSLDLAAFVRLNPATQD